MLIMQAGKLWFGKKLGELPICQTGLFKCKTQIYYKVKKKKRTLHLSVIVDQGSPIPEPQTGSAEQEVSSGWMAKLHLLFPIARLTAWTIPPPHPPSAEKPSSMKPVPGAKKVGDFYRRLPGNHNIWTELDWFYPGLLNLLWPSFTLYSEHHVL